MRVIIGTASLLGEGWDAPSLNTLILATTTTAYVQTNQLRGRAIRVLRQDPEKTANIWHLACVDPFAEDGGPDLQNLLLRFEAFEGLSYNGKTIENGHKRLGLQRTGWRRYDVSQHNQQTLELSRRRKWQHRAWHTALHDDTGQRQRELVERITTSKNHPLLMLRRGPGLGPLSLFGAGCSMVLWLDPLAAVGLSWSAGLAGMLLHAVVFGLLFLGIRGVKYVCAIYKRITRTDHVEVVRQLGEVVLASLRAQGKVNLQLEGARIKTDIKGEKTHLYLIGTQTYEATLFVTCLQEILGSVQNPRYIICYKRFLGQTIFLPVPSWFSRKAEAEVFFRHWRQKFGSGRLIYTRTRLGKQMLLQARLAGLRTMTHRATERQSVWQ